MKNVKKVFILSASAFLCLIGFNSCLGDKGNTTTSYGPGTIIKVNDTPCVRLDDINLNITGAGIPDLTDSVARAIVYYTIDWDNQPENAESRGIYDATISNISTWGVSDYTPGEPVDYDFKSTDTIRAIAQPFISYKTIYNPNMLTMNMRLFAGSGNVQLIQKNIPEDPNYMGMTTDTLIISYKADEITKDTRDVWYTFELPDYPSHITSVTLLFRSVSHSGFNPVWKKDLGGYIFTRTTKFQK